MATIETINHFIALNSHKTQHGLFKTIENCLQQNQTFYCKPPVPFYTTAICESLILQNLTTINWDICQIKVKRQKQTQWTHLQETNKWLFSAPHTEKIEVRCDQQLPVELLLHEFGIHQTDPYCQIITPDRILPYHTKPRNNEAHVYSNLQLRVPTVTKTKNIQNIITIQIVLYTIVAIFPLPTTSYVLLDIPQILYVYTNERIRSLDC